jgi:hypothetical protein
MGANEHDVVRRDNMVSGRAHAGLEVREVTNGFTR